MILLFRKQFLSHLLNHGSLCLVLSLCSLSITLSVLVPCSQKQNTLSQHLVLQVNRCPTTWCRNAIMASSSTSTNPLHRDQPAAKDGNSNGTEGDARRRQPSSPQGTTRERKTGRVEVREILTMRIRSPDRQTRLTPNQPEQAGAAEVKPKRSSQPKSSRSNASNRKLPRLLPKGQFSFFPTN